MNIFAPHGGTPVFLTQAMLQLETQLLHSSDGKRGTFTVLSGPSFSGKTTLLRHFAGCYPVQGDRRPVLYFQVPVADTCQQIAAALLEELSGIPGRIRSLFTLTSHLVAHFQRSRVQVLILDEAQHLLLPRAKLSKTVEWLAQLADRSGTNIIVAGTPEVEGVIASPHCQGIIRMPLLDFQTGGGWRELVGLLQAHRRAFEFGQSWAVDGRKALREIARYSNGLIGRVEQVISMAGFIAKRNGAPNLEVADIRRAIASLGG